MVRLANSADLPDMFAIEQVSFGPAAWSESSIEDELQGPDRTVFVATTTQRRPGEPAMSAGALPAGTANPNAGLTEDSRAADPAANYPAAYYPADHELTGVAAGSDEAIVGWASLHRLGDDIDLTRLVVDPRSRRCGIGAALLAEGIARARAARAVRLVLEVAVINEPAIGLYESHGLTLVATRRRYYADRTDALVMELHL